MMGNCQIVDGLRYEGGALMDAAANEIERLRKQLTETESHLESLQNRFDQVTAENERLRVALDESINGKEISQ